MNCCIVNGIVSLFRFSWSWYQGPRLIFGLYLTCRYTPGIEMDIALVLNWYYLKCLVPGRQVLAGGWYVHEVISVWSDSLIPGPVYKPGLQPGTRPALVSTVKSCPIDAETVVHPGSGTTLPPKGQGLLDPGGNERMNAVGGYYKIRHPPTQRGPDPGAQR